jgi:hypothetical protein
MNNQSTLETETRGGSCAPVTGSAAVEREKRQWWAIDTDDDDVKQVTGYSCAPNSPTYWWIPQLGASMPVGFLLFDTEREALGKAIEKLERKISVAQDNIEALKRRRQNVGTERRPPGEAVACTPNSQTTQDVEPGKRGGCSLQ